MYSSNMRELPAEVKAQMVIEMFSDAPASVKQRMVALLKEATNNPLAEDVRVSELIAEEIALANETQAKMDECTRLTSTMNILQAEIAALNARMHHMVRERLGLPHDQAVEIARYTNVVTTTRETANNHNLDFTALR